MDVTLVKLLLGSANTLLTNVNESVQCDARHISRSWKADALIIHNKLSLNTFDSDNGKKLYQSGNRTLAGAMKIWHAPLCARPPMLLVVD